MLLRWLRRAFSSKSSAACRKGRAPVKRPRRPFLEVLEDRTVPTVVYHTHFDPESVNPPFPSGQPFTVLNNATVYFIFWGSGWTDTNSGTLAADARSILGSHYLDGLSEYFGGANGHASIAGVPVVDTTNPPAGFSPGDLDNTHPTTDPAGVANFNAVQTEIQRAINNFQTIDPDSSIVAPPSGATLTNTPIYVVVTDPAHSAGTNGGYNTSGTYSSGSGNRPVHMISIGTSTGSSPGTINEDSFGLTFSHEMAERMSDPTTNGVTTNLPSTFPQSLRTNVGNQIGDGEAALANQFHYAARILGPNAVTVQPYWSGVNGAYIYTDGNSQKLDLSPIWNGLTFSGNYDLTIHGDQPGHGGAQTIAIDGSTASKLVINLNGEQFVFDAARINSITIDPGTASDTVHVMNTSVPFRVSGRVTFDADAGTLHVVSGGFAPQTLFVAAGATADLSNGASAVGSLTGSGTVGLGASGQLEVGVDNSSSTFSGAITGTAAPLHEDLLKIGTGTLTLSGNSNHTGFTEVQAGTLSIASPNGASPHSIIDLQPGATVTVPAGTAAVVSTLSGSGNVVLGGSLTVGGDGFSNTFGGTISGGGALVKQGSGTFGLSGTNTFTGGTQVSQGTLQAGSNGGIPAAGLQVDSQGTFDANGFTVRVGALSGAGLVFLRTGQLVVGVDNSSSTFSGTITSDPNTQLVTLRKEGTGTFTLTRLIGTNGITTVAAGTLRIGVTPSDTAGFLHSTVVVNAGTTLDAHGQFTELGNLAGSGSVLLNGTLLVGVNNANSAFGGAISGAGNLHKSGSGTLTLSGTGTYTGGTQVNEGTLQVGAANALPSTSGVNLAVAGSTLDLNNFSIALGSLTGVAGSRVLLGNGTLTEGAANLNDTFAGSISGNGGLTKVGTGTLTLSGSDPVFGTTHVTGGTLLVTGFLVGAVNLDAGTTLAGTGFTGNVSGAGTVSPGTTGATGVLGPENLSIPHGTLRVRLNGPSPGSGYDQVSALGVITLGGTAALNVTAGFTSPIGTTFTILVAAFDPTTLDLSGFVDGTFAGLPDGALLNAGGQVFRINYTSDGFGGGIVTLTHVATPTTTTLAADVNPSLAGQTVTLTATVAVPGPGTASPAGGTVTFFDGATSLGTATVGADGRATLATAALGIGSHSLTATFAAAGELDTSTSAALTQTVDQATTTTLSADVSPAVVGQTVTLTAVVSGDTATPTGMVTFLDGTTVLGTVTLDGSGTASLAVTLGTAGDHALTAVYSGDASSAASTSDVLTQTVTPAATLAALAADSAQVDFGVPVTLTATISAAAPGAGVPTGTVTFLEGGTVLGTGTLDGNGQATLMLDSLPSGTHSLTVAYASDGNFQDSLSDPLTLVVN